MICCVRPVILLKFIVILPALVDENAQAFLLSPCFSDLCSFYQALINYLTKHSKWI
jgi:hypothetical protein